jgi:hypothetical protein
MGEAARRSAPTAASRRSSHIASDQIVGLFCAASDASGEAEGMDACVMLLTSAINTHFHVGELQQRRVARHDQHRRTALQIFQKFVESRDAVEIEGSVGVVETQNKRVADEGANQADARGNTGTYDLRTARADRP